ncbi:MAG: BMC domain-containing protein [Candidatus Zixiibacteriota bacterium]|nr:MAG: BMC domain-containing protein [candidate division Zixibacteria bacterium]
MTKHALGLIETRGLVGAIEACDAAAKTASVTVTSVELTDAALLTLKIEGDLAAVQAAVEAGARAAERIGELVSEHVIPRPSPELDSLLALQRYIITADADKKPAVVSQEKREARPRRAPTPAPQQDETERTSHAPAHESRVTPQKAEIVKPAPMHEPSPAEGLLPFAELEKMPVVKLRRYARALPGLPIKGRQISMANKTQLLEAIKSSRGS